MKRILLSLTLLVGAWSMAAAQVQVQCPPNYVPQPYQDCPGAIPLCNIENFFADDSVCGEGNLIDEAIGTCGTNERVTTWYQFLARRPGRLRFRIIPNDVTGNALVDYDAATGQGDQDYDFVLYKLPSGTSEADTQICNLIRDRNNQYEVACNFSGEDGITGLWDENNAAATARFEDPIQVQQGDFFLLLVDNFRLTDIGYRIVFDDPDSLTTSTDVRIPQDPPILDTVTQVPNCFNNRLTFQFNKPVLCRDFDTFTFSVINQNFPSQVFTIDSIRGQNPCVSSQSNSQVFYLYFRPLIVDSTYLLVLNQAVSDLCGSVLQTDTVPFRIRPFVRLESFVNTFLQDSACCNTPVTFRATPDESLNATVGSFRYSFFLQDSVTNARLPLPDPNLPYSMIDTIPNEVYTTQCFPIRTNLRLKVIATHPLFSCVDSSFATFRYDPKPTINLPTTDGICFGETFNIRLNPDVDTAKYIYNWASRITGAANRPPRSGWLSIVGDTMNSVTGTEIHRGRNDELTLNVRYRDQFGGCVLDPQKITIPVGAYMNARFEFDSITRPGKDQPAYPRFALPDRGFYDRSVVRSLDPQRNNRRPQLWTIVNTDNNQERLRLFTYGPIDSTRESFTDSASQAVFGGNYLATLTLSDTLLNGKVCTSTFSEAFNVVDPIIPNLLTRNSDNQNDYFEIPNLLKQKSYRLTVFNRWGRVIYTADNYENGFRASDFLPGTYFYNLAPTAGDGPTYRGWLEISDQK